MVTLQLKALENTQRNGDITTEGVRTNMRVLDQSKKTPNFMTTQLNNPGSL